MNKKTIIDDEDIYVKSRESGLRVEYYFNRKASDNRERGHFVIVDGKVECNRQAPALSVLVSGGSFFLNISGTVFRQI